MGRYCTSALPLDKREWQDFWKSRFLYWEQNSLPTLTDNLVAPPFRRTLAKGGSQNETNPTRVAPKSGATRVGQPRLLLLDTFGTKLTCARNQSSKHHAAFPPLLFSHPVLWVLAGCFRFL